MRRRALEAPALALALGVLWWLLDVPAADLAAQEYRAALFEREGFTVWNLEWYGGHHLPAYSLLSPALGAWLGTTALGVGACVAGAAGWSTLVRHARLPALWGAVGLSTLLFTGRLTFALGTAFALWAGAALLAGRPRAATALTVVAAVASPMAGAFVALVGVAVVLVARHPPNGASRVGQGTAEGPNATLDARSGAAPAPLDARSGVALVVAGVAPTLGLMVLFAEGGTFPFVPASFLPSLAAVVLLAVMVPREQRFVRTVAWLYVAAVIALGVVPNAVGGNAVRLGAVLGGPVAALVLPRRRLLLLAPVLVYLQLAAPVDDVVRAERDRSTAASYYDGVTRFLASRPGPKRVEVPFTDNHWDARWVPRDDLVVARGWLRQIDREVNPVFYEDDGLDAAEYRAWLRDNAIAYVALHDAPMDYSAADEAQLLREGVAGLREVWRDEHWRVFAVAAPEPLARGGEVLRLRSDRFAVRLGPTGAAVVRVRHTRWYGPCADADGDGTRVRGRPGQTITVRAGFPRGSCAVSDG